MKIDTSTTSGKIAVMQAFEDGKDIERCLHGLVFKPLINKAINWNWRDCDYRIKPQTVEEAAEEFNKTSIPVAGLNSSEWVQQYFIAGAQWQKDQDND